MRFHVTTERIRQIECGAVARLRRPVREIEHAPSARRLELREFGIVARGGRNGEEVSHLTPQAKPSEHHIDAYTLVGNGV
jgi:hypothetical protein